MSERGVYAIDRGLFDHPFFAREAFTEREAWIWMIAEAVWKPRQKRVEQKLYELKRGQLAHSVRFMAAKWGWHRSRVERFLRRLKTEAMIETVSSVITICNYSAYQKVSLPFETVNETQPRHSRDKLEDRKDRKDKGSASRSRARARTLLPENWSPEIGWDETEDFQRFCDHARANGRLCADWEAAWRNWKRKSVELKQKDRQNGRRHGSVLDAFDRLGEKLKAAGATDDYIPGSSGPRPLAEVLRPNGPKLISSR